MVWIIRISLLILLIFSNNLYSNDLDKEQEMYFNFMDFDNDDKISLSEIEQTVSIVFQLIDLNQDGFISKSEINELKNILDSIK